MKYFVIPVSTGTTGIVNKELETSVNNIRKAFNRFPTERGQLYYGHGT
jgi:hypothetical protein